MQVSAETTFIVKSGIRHFISNGQYVVSNIYTKKSLSILHVIHAFYVCPSAVEQAFIRIPKFFPTFLTILGETCWTQQATFFFILSALVSLLTKFVYFSALGNQKFHGLNRGYVGATRDQCQKQGGEYKKFF